MKLFNLFISILRASPSILFVIGLILFIITRMDIYLMLLIVFTVSEIINTIMKYYIFKPIMKNKYWPILGYGTRPPNSKNSAQFGNINTPPYKGSYGMPSGHSQIMITVATFFIMTLFNYHSNIIPSILYFITFIVILFSLSVLWSRIYLNCHTIQQVILGSIFGFIIGYYGFTYGNMLM
jgi:membrane-associated phospholipid phosphatase